MASENEQLTSPFQVRASAFESARVDDAERIQTDPDFSRDAFDDSFKKEDFNEAEKQMKQQKN